MSNFQTENDCDYSLYTNTPSEEDSKYFFGDLKMVSRKEDDHSEYLEGIRHFYGHSVQQNYHQAFSCFSKAAKKGCVSAQYFMGLMLWNGFGHYKSKKEESFEWFKKAADQNYALAQYHLAGVYSDSKNKRYDDKKAFEYCKLAAEKGLVVAHKKLGDFYYGGIGCEKSYVKALELFKRAGEFKNISAKIMEAHMYFRGHGCEKNLEDALAIYIKVPDKMMDDEITRNMAYIYAYEVKHVNKAFEMYAKVVKKDTEIEYLLGKLLLETVKGDIYDNDNDDDDDDDNSPRNKAFELFYHAAGEGYALAQYEIGRYYFIAMRRSGKWRKIEDLDEKECAEYAFFYFQNSAKQGITDAEVEVGYMYEHGIGTKKDYKIAEYYYDLAAKKGNLLAQHYLGMLYWHGAKQNISIDRVKAFKLFHEAAKKNYDRSIGYIALSYYFGHGIERDLKEALNWANLAKENCVAQYVIGCCYENGWEVKCDITKAFEWYEKSALGGFVESRIRLAKDFHYGEFKEKNLNAAFNHYLSAAIYDVRSRNKGVKSSKWSVWSKWYEFKETTNYLKSIKFPEGDAEAQLSLGDLYLEFHDIEKSVALKHAMFWYQSAANQGNSLAFRKIAELYSQGLNGKPNFSKAIRWYKKAADTGHIEVYYKLGKLYFENEFGFSKTNKYRNAFTYFSLAAEQKNVDAYYWMGKLYHGGKGVDSNGKDYDKAIEWYKKAASNDNVTAIRELIKLYSDGHQVEQNYQEVFKWLSKLSESKDVDPESLINLGDMYFNGDGVSRDFKKALEMYKLAAKKCLPIAYRKIGDMYLNGQGVEKDVITANSWYEKDPSV